MERTVKYLRDREWVQTVAALTALGVAAVEYLEVVSDAAAELTGNESAVQIAMVLFGVWRARQGVNSNATVQIARDGLDPLDV